MSDARQALNVGYILRHGSMHIEIKEELGRGGNSIVYLGEYPDSVMSNKPHRCIIKELFAYHPKGLVYRAADSRIVTEDYEFSETHRKSFIRGNRIHLDTLYNNPEITEANIDSFEANNTLYTILGFDGAVSISGGTRKFENLRDTVDFTLELLDLIEPFHKNNMLHLDISPDNIIMSENSGRLMLIDFNGSVDLSADYDPGYFSVNPRYSPPELKLGRRNNLTTAADIFSVCAVMVYVITGKDFDYVGTNIKSIQNERLVRDENATAKQYLTYILSKGLRANPKLRFQTVSELREALCELSARINGAGMTHASLWEVSKRLTAVPEKDLIESKIAVNGSEMPSGDVVNIKNVIISGVGGMGKTTLFKRLVYESTRSYNVRTPVRFYVPLYDYDGKRDFIKRYIASKIRYSEETATLSDAIKQFTELIEHNDGFIYILLDGFNEITCDSANLIREIKELCAMRGAGIAISSRNAGVLEELSGFAEAEILPIDENGIKAYLNKRGTACPEDKALMRLLGNPLMLTLYTKTSEVLRTTNETAAEPVTQEDIIEGYLASLLAAKRNVPSKAEGETERFEYILTFLLPAICTNLKNGGELSYDRLRKICSADRKRLRSRAFSKAFPKFAGRSKAILGGVKTADEWLDTAVNKILADETALIVRENGKYRAMHMNLAECEAKHFADYMRRYRCAVLADRAPITLILVICLAAAGYTGVYFAPHTHPLGSAEKHKCDEAVIVTATHLANAANMTLSEQNIISQMEAGSRQTAIIALEQASNKIETRDYYSFTDCSEYAFRGLDTERINGLGDLVIDHYEFWLDLSERLFSALSPDSRYTEEYIKDAAENYSEYIEVFERRMGYEMYLSFSQLKDSADDTLLKALKSSGSIIDAYTEAAVMGEELTKNKISETERELTEAKLALDIIQK